MRQSYFPSTDSGMKNWSAAFAGTVWAERVALGIAEPLAVEVVERQQAFAEQFALAQSDATRTKLVTLAKNRALAAFKETAREVVGLVRARRDLDDAWLAALGLSVPKRARERIPPPAEPPHVFLGPVRGRIVPVMLGDAASGRIVRPKGAAWAMLYGAIGEEPLDDASRWTVRELTSRARCRMTFPAGLPAGAKVHIAACWVSRRAQESRLSDIHETHLGYCPNVQGAAA